VHFSNGSRLDDIESSASFIIQGTMIRRVSCNNDTVRSASAALKISPVFLLPPSPLNPSRATNMVLFLNHVRRSSYFCISRSHGARAFNRSYLSHGTFSQCIIYIARFCRIVHVYLRARARADIYRGTCDSVLSARISVLYGA